MTVSEVINGPWVVQSIAVLWALGAPQKSCSTDVIGRPICQPWVGFDVYSTVAVATFTNRYGFY